jgi:hypothetical protein
MRGVGLGCSGFRILFCRVIRLAATSFCSFSDLSKLGSLIATRKLISAGDYFSIPLHESDSVQGERPLGLGQILSLEKDALNSYGCAFWPFLEEDVVSQLATPPAIVTLVTPDFLKSRLWKVQGNAPVSVAERERRYEKFRERDWVGAKILGSGIIRSALRAFHGLEYWDQFAEPDYLTRLLQPTTEIPKNARFKPRA